MFQKIPTVLTAQELLDIALKKTQKISIRDHDKRYQTKKTVIARTESFVTTLTNKLDRYITAFPSLDRLPRFYQELIDIKINTDHLKKSLGAVHWASNTIKSIYAKQRGSLRKTGNINFLKQKQKEIYGRVSSVLKQVNTDLLFLKEAHAILKQFPDIQDIPTVVIAGPPNVGKSSLLRCLSAAKPRIAQYPFTTQEIHVGHITVHDRHVQYKIQLIDTPGLLDRPLTKRNAIEKQAIAALRHLADIILFIRDPSQTCGYTLTEQDNLLHQITQLFPDQSVIVVNNKMDLSKESRDGLQISCTKKIGIDVIRERLIDEFTEAQNINESV